jgi:hypothetical protein
MSSKHTDLIQMISLSQKNEITKYYYAYLITCIIEKYEKKIHLNKLLDRYKKEWQHKNLLMLSNNFFSKFGNENDFSDVLKYLKAEVTN